MFEIGTGQAAAEILSIFDLTEMKFSSDGRYLALGSSSGSVSVWALGEHLYSSVTNVLDAMKTATNFWNNFPIYLPDYEKPRLNDEIIVTNNDNYSYEPPIAP